mmetsp:Transcript_29068/g.60557  ORF Transcript_29068/g.60557 Transcript_29068/m.60557 type:complete len:85 (-) Transcript_29068:622-876(-)
MVTLGPGDVQNSAINTIPSSHGPSERLGRERKSGQKNPKECLFAHPFKEALIGGNHGRGKKERYFEFSKFERPDFLLSTEERRV